VQRRDAVALGRSRTRLPSRCHAATSDQLLPGPSTVYFATTSTSATAIAQVTRILTPSRVGASLVARSTHRSVRIVEMGHPRSRSRIGADRMAASTAPRLGSVRSGQSAAWGAVMAVPTPSAPACQPGLVDRQQIFGLDHRTGQLEPAMSPARRCCR
jgi:hypothetical protein